MQVVFIFLDESRAFNTAWLTGILVHATQQPAVRDAVITIARDVLIALGQNPSSPIELHGCDMLRDLPGASDLHRLKVFSEVVSLVNRERLEILSVGHHEASQVRKNLGDLLMDPGDKLYYLNLEELVESLNLADDVLVVPVFDGVPGRSSRTRRSSSVDKFAYDAFLRGGVNTHWRRIHLEKNPVPLCRVKQHLRNLVEPMFSDSASSPLLQLADMVGYLLGAAEGAEQSAPSPWNAQLAAIASELDPNLVSRRSVTLRFESA